MLNPNILILTATITPPRDVPRLARSDPGARLDDYRRSLDFYLSCLQSGKISRLIFAENSASDISKLEDLCRQRNLSQHVEFISFNGLDYPSGYGRGYGEFKMVDHVMEHSQLIRQWPDHANIWKVTGRYIFRNLADVIKTCPAQADFYCNCRNMPLRWADLHSLCWNKTAYEAILKNVCQSLRTDNCAVDPEQSFRRVIDGKDLKINIVKRFRVVPEIEGVRGYNNQSYETERGKLLLRKLANRIAPWLWI